ncbi:MAG: TauD/TfdA family dioxygenase [Acidimicrobiia bacterium]|nr:TauD/TfdA family dioxygenase [Acidimicrobiia bacterium]
MTVESATSVEVRPLSVHIGAEIAGVDLSHPIEPVVRDQIWAALLRWKVLFFRDQRLDHDSHVAAARQFGLPTPGHVVFGGEDDHPAVYSIAKHRTANSGHGPPMLRPWTGWHTDITAAINPPGQSLLRGDVVPPYGGDTQWTNLVAAYQALSPTLRSFLDGLRAIHRFAPATGREASGEYRARVAANTLVSEHPLIRVHPETGERVLYVSPGFLSSIVDLSPRESQGLLELLWEHSVRPEFTVRFRWEPGSVAFWDNRSTAHLAPRDIFDSDFERQFWRVTLMGEVPFGVDGRPSTALEGAPIAPVAGH